MKMSKIEEPLLQSSNNSKYAFLDLAFRPFFIGAAGFAIFSMIVWTWIYSFSGDISSNRISPFVWHAHEMIFGYSVAVIAGFVLTAIQNWTGVATVKGKSLLVLFLIWVSARLLATFPILTQQVTALLDISFYSLLLYFAVRPILQVKQYKQLSIVIVLFLLLISNSIYYSGILQLFDNGIYIGLYSGLYLILLLIFIMARRVIPFFIEKGVDENIKIKNYKWLDVSSIVLFIAYAIFDIFKLNQDILMVLAGSLLMLHSIRMLAWYHKGIWRKPLLWSIVLAYGFIVFGFALKLMINYYGFTPYLEIHSFSVGGIALLTLGMMSRVALGHTGRNVFKPPKTVFWMVLLIAIAAFCRVILPIFLPHYYSLIILLSQLFWISAFSLFLIVYFPILIKARIDGRPG
ncbi:NnrS protein involved in response to NO [hydrothermal vent metagenome]|uniref:NnrS protein involved in response to NO n=1 Tax=hydrothermal vent metagenome TaxID=652676 RepID=A0A3B1AKA4_9ZZZZ